VQNHGAANDNKCRMNSVIPMGMHNPMGDGEEVQENPYYIDRQIEADPAYVQTADIKL